MTATTMKPAAQGLRSFVGEACGFGRLPPRWIVTMGLKALGSGALALFICGAISVATVHAESRTAPSAPQAAPPAQPAPKSLTLEDIQKKYEKFDSRAVAAARHYTESPIMRDGMKAMQKNMGAAMFSVIAQRNPALSPQQREDAAQLLSQVTDTLFDRIVALSVLNTLETFATDEIIAMDNFYSSPTGVSILSKMPKLTSRLPAMMQMLMPEFEESFRVRAKAKGLELKI